MADFTGQMFAGFEILAKCGEGGMGSVWKARQPMLNRFVALKMMASELATDPEFVRRFKREANSAAGQRERADEAGHAHAKASGGQDADARSSGEAGVGDS